MIPDKLDAAGRCFRCEHAASINWLRACLRDALERIEMAEVELKPCPRCGAPAAGDWDEASFREDDQGRPIWEPGVFVYCSAGCNYTQSPSTVMFETFDEAAEAWNRGKIDD